MFRCNNARDCEIRAASDNFGGDPCPGTGKYLEVYFGCFPGKFYLLCFIIICSSLVNSHPRLSLLFLFSFHAEYAAESWNVILFFIVILECLFRFLFVFSSMLLKYQVRLFVAQHQSSWKAGRLTQNLSCQLPPCLGVTSRTFVPSLPTLMTWRWWTRVRRQRNISRPTLCVTPWLTARPSKVGQVRLTL